MHPAELRSKILKWKGVRHGYVNYTGQRVNMSLNPGPVLDRIHLNHGNKPIKPILFKSQRHYAFVGRAIDIIDMQIELIRTGYPFQVIGLQPDQVDEKIMHHANVFFDITYYRPAPTIQRSLSSAYCWLLGPASPSAISAVTAKTAYAAGTISHGTEVSIHTSFQFIETSHHAAHHYHGLFTKSAKQSIKIEYHLNPIERWIISSPKIRDKYKLQNKVQIDIGCEIAATNKSSPPYDTKKKSSKDQPLDISTELLCLSINYILTGRKPFAPFPTHFLDVVKAYILTDNIPDYLLHREHIMPMTVMQDTEHECYLASIICFFHKVSGVYDKALSKEQAVLRKELEEVLQTQADDYLSRQRRAINTDETFVSEEEIYHACKGLKELVDITKILAASLEHLVYSRLTELMIYVKTGKLSDKLQVLVDANPSPKGSVVDNKQQAYDKTLELLYYMTHETLPERLGDSELSQFIEYTQTGIKPAYLSTPIQPNTVNISSV